MDEKEEKGKSYRAFKIALGMLLASILLQAVEVAAKQNQLEFRTFVQELKGVFQWFIVPLAMVFAIDHDFLKGKMWAFFRYVILAAFIIAITLASLFRGFLYVFNEQVTEEVMEDGRIKGCLSTFAGTTWYYYEPVFGIFKTPFAGWGDGELLGILARRHGDGISYVGEGPGGCRIYEALGGRPGAGPFYFQAGNGYEAEENFLYSLMKRDAAAFWAKKDRKISFVDESRQAVGFSEREIWDNKENPGREDRLMVECYLREDVPACAADLADWLFYAAEDGRYFPDAYGPSEQGVWAPDVLFCVWVNYRTQSGQHMRMVFLSDCRDALKEGDWEDVKGRIEDNLTRFYNQMADRDPYGDAQGSEETGSLPGDTAQEEEDWEEAFLAYYQGDYEKEVFLPEGEVGYRMVTLDAALGSRMYGLIKSTDHGESWQVVNRDPFGETGMGGDFTFLDEEFGFASLMHNGGDEAELFVTEDGGESYGKSVIQGLTVTLQDGYTYNPYDYPRMPYEENGRLYLLCGQGTDGDYAGGDQAALALFESTDHGHTFVFKEMREGAD